MKIAPSFRDRVKDFRRVKANELLGSAQNWRRHPSEQRAAFRGILAELGFAGAVLAREIVKDGKKRLEVLDGHLRKEEMGRQEIPVLVTDLTPEEADLLMATYDPIGAMATANDQALKDLLADIKTQDAGLQAMLEEMGKTNRIELHAQENEPAEPDLDQAAELQRKWTTKRGQLWALAEHRLLRGDALDPESWKCLRAPFNFCFADPPYELLLNVESFRPATCRDLLLMTTDKVFLQQSANAFRGFFCYLYDSSDTPPWFTMPMRQHSLIGWWCWKPLRRSFKGLSTVIQHQGKNQEAGTGHEQSKPLGLLKTLLPYFTKPGEPFADGFSGSGSAIFAAEQLNRKARSVELEPRWVALILERWLKAGGDKPKLLA